MRTAPFYYFSEYVIGVLETIEHRPPPRPKAAYWSCAVAKAGVPPRAATSA